jgi:hypothetical protein
MAEKTPDKPADDAKAKFREALERKKAGEQSRPDNIDGSGAVHGAHTKAGGKRQFQRRKSG